MAKKNTKYICTNCGFFKTIKFGLCPECKNGFGELEEDSNETLNKKIKGKVEKRKRTKPIVYSNQEIDYFDERIKTQFPVLNKMFGGEIEKGIMKNSLTLIGGEPGIGKSTLLLQMIDYISSSTELKCAYVSGEENESQIKNRCKRLNLNGVFAIEHESNVSHILNDFEDFDFLIIDSINTMFLEGSGTIGGVSQIREITILLMDWAKKFNKTIIIVGQVSKDGDIAGPMVLKHMVDTVFYIDNYDKSDIYKIIRNLKNRFGDTNEIDIYVLENKGVKEIEEPSLLFVDKDNKDFGSSISLIYEGTKPIFVETQALVSENKQEKPFVQSIGYDVKRIYQIITILQKYNKVYLYDKNIFVNVIGGLNIKNPFLDLSIAAAILSSLYEKPNNDNVFIGEIGLNGKIISPPNYKQTEEQFLKYGFENIISSKNGYSSIKEIFTLYKNN